MNFFRMFNIRRRIYYNDINYHLCKFKYSVYIKKIIVNAVTSNGDDDRRKLVDLGIRQKCIV